MANWGVPDYDATSEAEQEVTKRAEALRETLRSDGHMDRWPFCGPAGFDKETVHKYCVDTSHPHVAAWQKVRLSMKGKPTHEKLAILLDWNNKGVADPELATATLVQVYNYLGALRRGGQLDEQNRVRKYR